MIAPSSRIRPLPAAAPPDQRAEREATAIRVELRKLVFAPRSTYLSKGAPGAGSLYEFWSTVEGEERIVKLSMVRGRVVRVRVFREEG